MRISFRNRFVMFDIPKSASTSVNQALAPVSETVLDGDGGVKHINVRLFEEHLAPLLEKCIGPAADRLERIAIVREPFDMLRSYYTYLRRPGIERPDHVDNDRNALNIEFSDFVAIVCAKGPSRFRGIGRPSGFVADSKGLVGIDAIFAMERLPEFAGYMSQKTGRTIEIPHRNVSQERVGEQLPAALVAKVKDVMAADFALHAAALAAPEGAPLRVRGRHISALDT